MNNKLSADGKSPCGRLVHTNFKSPLISRKAKTGNNHSPLPAQLSQPAQSADDSLHQRVDDGLHQRADDGLQRVDDIIYQGSSAANAVTVVTLQKEMDGLSQELMEVEDKIQQLREQGFEESELGEHIKKLHEYNEIKDMAQMVLGHIATLQGVRTQDLYAQYGLELAD